MSIAHQKYKMKSKNPHHIPCSIINVNAGRTKSSDPADHLRLNTTIPGILIPEIKHKPFVRPKIPRTKFNPHTPDKIKVDSPRSIIRVFPGQVNRRCLFTEAKRVYTNDHKGWEKKGFFFSYFLERA